MIQRDYIQRMIEQMSQVMAKLLKLEVPLEKVEIIHQAYQGHLGVSATEIRAIAPENVVDFLRNTHKMHVGQLEFFAELLAKEGEYLVELEQYTDAKNCLIKADLLFEAVEIEQGLYSMERMETLGNIKRLLEKCA